MLVADAVDVAVAIVSDAIVNAYAIFVAVIVVPLVAVAIDAVVTVVVLLGGFFSCSCYY